MDTVGTHNNHCCLIPSLWNHEKAGVDHNKIKASLSFTERRKFECERCLLSRVQISPKNPCTPGIDLADIHWGEVKPTPSLQGIWTVL